MLRVFVRGLNKQDKEFITKIMEASGFTEWEFTDILVEDISKSQEVSEGIVFGDISARLVNKYVTNLLILPTINQLKLNKENKKHREQAWKSLNNFKESLDKKSFDTQSKNWEYATMFLPTNKKIVVYENKKPDIDADIFLSREDSSLLLKVKEIFKAEAIILSEED